MGCDVSKSTDVIETEEIESDTFEFTDTQIDTIRSTWPILACDMTDIGSKVFLKIFLEEPKLKYIFSSFSDMEENELVHHPLFIDHVTRFMQIIDYLVENLDQEKSDFEQALLMLGAKHATFPGFQVSYLNLFTKALLEVWESAIGEEFIPEVQQCWAQLFTYIMRYIVQGYELYFSECQDDIVDEKS
ncbi:cytoglobin-2-like [Saccostrea echinata]|uniref:cytoglobin-2-like n=1 Tax=Saccostrea echinata TaxID=191078 RepID=UPI002A84190B|nr:cytoglobin-2-like [Saccostrea echinata]